MASSPQHEPTMEEILASIRKIISEDSTEPHADSGSTAPEGDVLELTQEVQEEPAPAPAPAPVVMAAPPPPAAPEPAAVAAAPQAEPPKPENDVVFQTIEEEAPVSSEALAPHEGIFSEKTRKAVEDTFANIQPARAADAPAAGDHSMPPMDGATVQAAFEKAVRESFDPVLQSWLSANSDSLVEKLKPLVRAWMDEHFPALLEGAVRAEVERVARARH